MNYFVKVFLVTGFIISFCDVCEYADNLKNIHSFKKVLKKFQKSIENYPDNKTETEELLSKLLFLLPFYEASNHRKQMFFDENNNCTNWLTGDWLANIEYFFQNDSRYPYETLQTRIKFSLNECDSALGISSFALKRAIYKLIPIFYANVIINFLHSCFFFSHKQDNSRVSVDSNVRWLSIVEHLISFLANVIVVIPAMINFFSYLLKLL